MRALRLSLLVILLVGALAASAAAAAGPPREPFFPAAGNAGIDVLHYGASFAFQPRSGAIRADTAVTIRATRDLRRFSLDLNGLHVTSVEINGEPARSSRSRGKLWVEPPATIPAGERFYVTVLYRGQPRTVVDPDGTREGWVATDDGALALGEPQGTAAWLPCDNVPADKATFDVTIVVPRPLVAVSNGRLRGPEALGGKRRYSWHEAKPMSTYLALVDIGRGRLTRSTIAGLPAWTLVDPRLAKGSRPVLAELPRIVRFESGLYGSYPFEAAGSVVDYAPKIGYALENQTRPFYPYVPDLTTVVHETAHQWFGDSVGLKRWPNIWLNEGFATWTEWYYAERHGRRSARAIFNRLYRVPAANTKFWNPPSGHPGSAEHLFGPSVYVRGAMALEALRLKIGTEPLLHLLHEWAVGHRYGSADIAEFTALAEAISGQNLGPFFRRWLYRKGKP
ncbi:MAG TPA: M1 family metallopeptidase [Solirubrobacterales bacterium]|nr:M1 family metallopeptidase [Solirubrobacterales bacterium]